MERLDDVLGYNLKVYQRSDWFSFSLDSVLLANFPRIKGHTKKVLDLGTGNGIIPLILSLRTKAHILGVDIQKDLIDLAQKSVDYNNLDNQIKLKCCDMHDLLLNKDIYNSYDLILSNPPYFSNYERSTKNDDIHKTIARHEVKITLQDIVFIANRLLKDGGVFALIHRTDRLIEIVSCFQKNNIEPKLIHFIYKNYDSPSYMVYVEGIKNGKPGLKIAKPFVLYNNDGSMSDDYAKLCSEVYV